MYRGGRPFFDNAMHKIRTIIIIVIALEQFTTFVNCSSASHGNFSHKPLQIEIAEYMATLPIMLIVEIHRKIELITNVARL